MTNLGGANFTIGADTSPAESELQAFFAKQAQQIGQFKTRFQKELSGLFTPLEKEAEQFAQRFQKATTGLFVPITQAAEKAGQEAGKKLSEGVQENLGKVDLGEIDATEVQSSLATLDESAQRFKQHQEEARAAVKETGQEVANLAGLVQATEGTSEFAELAADMEKLGSSTQGAKAGLDRITDAIKEPARTAVEAAKEIRREFQSAGDGISRPLNEAAQKSRAAMDSVTKRVAELNDELQKTGKVQALGGFEGTRQTIKDLKLVDSAIGDIDKKNQGRRLLPNIAREREDLVALQRALKANLSVAGKPLVDPQQVVLADQALKKLIKDIHDLTAAQQRGPSTVINQAIQETKQQAVVLSQALGQLGPEGTFEDLAKGFETAKEPATGFQKVIGGLNEKLSKFGLSVSGISVLLGAGFAGGLAGILKITLDLSQAFIQAVGEIRKVDKATQFAFRGAASDIRAFADEVSNSTGRTRTEILKTANTFAQLGRTIGLTRDEIPGFSKAFAEFAAQIEKFVPSVQGMEGAADLLARVINGDREAIAELGFTFEELNEIVQNKFGKNLDVLTQSEKILLANALAGRAAADGIGEFGVKIETLGDRFRNARDDFLGFFSRDAAERLRDARVALEDIARTDILQRIGLNLDERRLGLLSGDLKKLSDEQLATLRKEFEAHEGIRRAIDKVTESRKKEAAATLKQQEANEGNIDAIRLNIQEFLANTSAVRQLDDAIKQLTRTQEDNALRITQSIEELRRAREDAALREDQIRRDNIRGLEDANRQIGEANRELERARVDRIRDIEKVEFEHNRKLQDLRTKREDADIEHRRRLEDLNREHDRKLEDFVKKQRDLKRQEVEDTLEAQVSLFEAQLKGDAFAINAAKRNLSRLRSAKAEGGSLQELELERTRELEDFKREIQRENKDRIRELAELEREEAHAREDRIRELADIEIESNRQIFDSHQRVLEALQERQRAVEDAVKDLHELEIENNRALFDAQRGVRDAHREAQRAIEDQRLTLRRLFEDYGLPLDALERIITGHERWRDVLEEVAEGVKRVSKKVQHLADILLRPVFQEELTPQGSALDALLNPEFSRQHGGPFGAGRPFLGLPLGEHGLPELIIPGASGVVVSNRQILEALRSIAGNGKGGINAEVNIFDSRDSEANAVAVVHRLMAGLN